MATVDTCSTPEEGWGLVHHFLGNILLVIRLALNDKETGWESVVAEKKAELVSHLKKITERMSDYGYSIDSKKIGEIYRMVKDLDLTNPANIDLIHAKNHGYSPTAGAMKEKVQELFGNKE